MSAPTMTASPVYRPRAADRVAVPFWNGVLSAFGAVAIALVGGIAVVIVLDIALVLATGHTPSANPGHPFVVTIEVIFYVIGGAFAWFRLRRIGRNPFRKLTWSDARVVLIGVGALILVRVATALQLIFTGQTKHVQSGLEHFDVVSKVPLLTTASIVLIVLSTVILAPLVEEMIFRGLLFGALAPRLGVVAAAVITALIFGAVHGDLILFPTLAALGFVGALAYAATGNLWVSVTLHALNNALAVAALVLTSLNHHA